MTRPYFLPAANDADCTTTIWQSAVWIVDGSYSQTMVLFLAVFSSIISIWLQLVQGKANINDVFDLLEFPRVAAGKAACKKQQRKVGVTQRHR